MTVAVNVNDAFPKRVPDYGGDSYEVYRGKMLEQGRTFADYVTRWLYHRGLILLNFASQAFQYQVGENIVGAEIKRATKFRTLQTLYIETDEKSHPDRPNFSRSGIYRCDNSWLFITGDERDLWILSTRWLREMEQARHKNSQSYRFTRAQTPTSKGFRLPLALAEKCHLLRLHDPTVPIPREDRPIEDCPPPFEEPVT